MESDTETPIPRASKFKEATMNSVASIHPPPDELWRDLGIDKLLDKFNEENKAPPRPKKEDSSSAPPSANEGTFGRFSRAITNFFGGGSGGFSALGKRKAGNQTAEKDDRRKQAELAYQEAKELGLLPAPKVFVRPTAKPHKSVTTSADTPAPIPQSRTPTLYKSSSKKDLQKQKKLTKRVSDLEFKLAAARKELSLALSPENTPPVPPIPATLPSTPTPTQPPSKPAPQPVKENNISPHNIEGSASSSKQGKITKKRKVTSDDQAYRPVTTDSDMSFDEGERSSKRSKTIKKPKRQSSRLSKRGAKKSMEEVVIVVPDGVTVPPIPSIPNGVGGKRAAVSDDGYGGLGHEMF